MVGIFVGHARQNADAASQIAQALVGQGYSVQTSEAVGVGSNWREATESAIRAADAYVYLHSPDAAASPWLQNELLYVLSQKKPIIPVILAPADIPQAVLNFQFIDATAGIKPALQKIALAVDAVTSFPAPQTRTATVSASIPAEHTLDQLPMPAPAKAIPAPQPVRAAPKRAGIPFWLIAIAVLILGVIAALVVVPMFLRAGGAQPPETQQAGITSSNLTDTAIAQAIDATDTPPPTASPESTSNDVATHPATFPILPPTAGFPIPTQTVAIEVAVARTVSAIRATDEGSLSASELALIAPISQRNDTPIVLAGLIAALSLGVSGAALFVVLRTNSRRPPPRRAHSPHHGQANPQAAGLPAPLLADFQVFTSSSEKDREWVERLIEDLQTMGYLVWWYAKDAPGLPFGNEIRSAIYHTKVFMIILSPDSMISKHIEEEIRWAEIYDRPIVPLLYRSVSVEERLYGLAKGADIDFTDDAAYREALDLLAQAIEHYLQKRLAALPKGA